MNDTAMYLGLGKGAMERLAIYPILMWVIGFGFYIAGYTRNTEVDHNYT